MTNENKKLCQFECQTFKVAYHRATGRGHARSLAAAVEGVGLKFEGQPHSGIDDSVNAARVLKKLAETGYVFENTFVMR